ncbi:MAG: cysteine hydrolase family protein [Thermoanaerobaculia bacterium]
MKRALLLIDLQKDYFPGGAMELDGSDDAVNRASELLDSFRRAVRPVIHIQHVSVRPGATFFLPGTAGVEIHPSVAPLSGETLFRKHYPNSFRETPLLEHLRALGPDQLVIAGMMTHMCVDTTTRAAADYGFSCELVHDACATRDLRFGERMVAAADVQTSYLAALDGSFATVRTSADIALEL